MIFKTVTILICSRNNCLKYHWPTTSDLRIKELKYEILGDYSLLIEKYENKPVYHVVDGVVDGLHNLLLPLLLLLDNSALYAFMDTPSVHHIVNINGSEEKFWTDPLHKHCVPRLTCEGYFKHRNQSL